MVILVTTDNSTLHTNDAKQRLKAAIGLKTRPIDIYTTATVTSHLPLHD